MNILVTAGNTQVPIDTVRCLTNIFSGRTGAAIGLAAHRRGHHVTLLTSRPEAVAELQPDAPKPDDRWQALRFRTFSDLENLLPEELRQTSYDAVIHSASVSDYRVAGIFAPAPGTSFSSKSSAWTGAPATLVNRAAAKVKSDEPELWLRLVRAPKLVDKIRRDWSFRGILVKFKLEVGVSEETLLSIAEKSRLQSDADLMVANTLEEAGEWAYLGPRGGIYDRIARRDLPERLLDLVQRKHMEQTHA